MDALYPKISILDDFQKYMIDLNDPQTNQDGSINYLLTNKTFKNQIESGECRDLPDSKYIIVL